MTRYYCDLCGDEVERSANCDVWSVTEQDPFAEDRKVKVAVEAIVSINGATNAGTICRACIVRVVQGGDVRSGRAR